MWGMPALDSPLGQVVLLQIWCLPEIRFHWFALLSSQHTGLYWVHLFWLALVSVDLIQAPPRHWKSQVRGRGADKQNVKRGNWEAEGRVNWQEHPFPSQKYGMTRAVGTITGWDLVPCACWASVLSLSYLSLALCATLLILEWGGFFSSSCDGL